MITNYWAIIFGIVQGITEFVPISSSGHLVALHALTGVSGEADSAFDVALHVGTLLALLVFFWRDIVVLLRAWGASLVAWNWRNLSDDARLAWQLLVATIPVLIVGGLGGALIEDRFRSLPSVAMMLIIFGILFFIFEATSRQRLRMTDLTWAKALKIGFAQILALVPGVSRSGVTIIAGLGEGLKRDEAARFSFLLAIPAVAAAAVKKGYDVAVVGLPVESVIPFILGVAVAAVVGWLAIRYLLQFLAHHSLAAFGWYRIGLGILLWLLWYRS